MTSKTGHDKHGAGDDSARKSHPALDDRQDPPERTRDGGIVKAAEEPTARKPGK